MRILHLIPALDPGGTERIMLNLAWLQKKRGDVIQIISFADRNSYAALSEGLDIKIIQGIAVEWKWLRVKKQNTDKLAQAITQFEPDTIHSHALWTDHILYSLKTTFKVKRYVSHFHLYYDFFKDLSLFNPHFLGHWVVKNQLFKQYKRQGTTFISISKSIDRYYKSSFPNSLKGKIELIPNAIDLSYFQAKKTTNLGSPYKLLTVSRLVETKNLYYLLNVARHLVDVSDSNFLWHIVGEGRQYDELQQKIIAYGLTKNVVMLGRSEDMPTVYSQYHLLVHTAKKEPFGLVFLEAMAAALPTISLRAGGNEDIIDDCCNGRLLPSTTSAKEFAEEVWAVLNDKKRIEKLTEKGLKKVQEYSIQKYEQKVRQIYNQ